MKPGNPPFTPKQGQDDSVEEEKTSTYGQGVADPILRTELQIPQAVIDRYETNQKEQQRREKWKFRVEIFTLVAVLGAAAAAFLQWRSAEQSIKLAEDTAQRQLRAYVLLDHDKIFENLRFAVGERPTGMLRVKNFGLTPAHNLIVLRRTAIGPWPLPEDTDFTITPTHEGSQITAPGSVTYWGFGSSGKVVSEEEFTDAKSGKRRFYIFGKILYTDAFKKSHYTNFGLAVPPLDDIGSGFGLERCQQHNEAN